MTERSRTPERRNPHCERLFQLAKESEAAKQRLLAPEFVAYCLAWKEQINPDSQAFSVFHAGSGPDVATPLFTADATTLYQVDRKPTQREQFQHHLERWNTIEQEANTAGKILHYEVGHRKTACYWDIATIRKYSIEYLTLIELKKMGVTNAPRLIENKQYATLEFEWTYPGQSTPKPREIHFVLADVVEMMTWNQPFPIPAVDGYLEKSMHHSSIWQNPGAVDRIQTYLKDDGVMLLGGSPAYKEAEHRQSDRRGVYSLFRKEDTITPISVPPVFTRKMIEYQRAQYSGDMQYGEYGWYLIGGRKTK